MKKILTAVIVATSLFSTSVSAKADTPVAPSIAILDTAINSSLPVFKDKIAAEVCMINWTTCPNGKSFMEGPGAAGMPANLIGLNGFDHGNEMASIAIANNPNIKIVFIKIIGNTATGARQITFESAIYNALNWIAANKDRLNIQAVTMAQGHHTLLSGTDYCPKTPQTEIAVKNLSAIGIPVFFPAGNGRDYQRLDWPACIDASISVGAVDQQNEITSYSNNDSSKLDFFALGNMPAVRPDGVTINVAGTSAAIQVAAAQWISVKQSKPGISYSDEYALLSKTASSTIGRQGTFKKLINVKDALNG